MSHSRLDLIQEAINRVHQEIVQKLAPIIESELSIDAVPLLENIITICEGALQRGTCPGIQDNSEFYKSVKDKCTRKIAEMRNRGDN